MSPHGGHREGSGRKPTGVPLRKPMQVLLTDEERELLDAAAAPSGLGTSTWLRTLGLATARRLKRKGKKS